MTLQSRSRAWLCKKDPKWSHIPESSIITQNTKQRAATEKSKSKSNSKSRSKKKRIIKSCKIKYNASHRKKTVIVFICRWWCDTQADMLSVLDLLYWPGNAHKAPQQWTGCFVDGAGTQLPASTFDVNLRKIWLGCVCSPAR